MSLGDAPDRRQAALRAMAHPVRLRILSLLTGAALTAADVARELGLTHANASYHLRNLLAAGLIVPAGEERIRGGMAKRYRYDADRARERDRETLAGPAPPRPSGPCSRPSPTNWSAAPPRRDWSVGGTITDAELWVDPEVWREIRERIGRGRRGPARGGPAAAHPGHGPDQRHHRDVPDGADRERRFARRCAHAAPSGYLLAGRTVNTLGNAIAPIALAFAVLDLTGSASDLGLVVGARIADQRAVPALRRRAGRPAAAAPADGRRRASLAAVTQGAVAALVLTGTATVAAADRPVRGQRHGQRARLAGLLGDRRRRPSRPVIRQQANALNRLCFNGAMIVGAPLGGVIVVAAVGPGWGLAVDAVAFLLSAAAFALLRLPAVEPRRPAGRAGAAPGGTGSLHGAADRLDRVPQPHLALGGRRRVLPLQLAAQRRACPCSGRSSPTTPSAGGPGASCWPRRPPAWSSAPWSPCGCGVRRLLLRRRRLHARSRRCRC